MNDPHNTNTFAVGRRRALGLAAALVAAGLTAAPAAAATWTAALPSPGLFAQAKTNAAVDDIAVPEMAVPLLPDEAFVDGRLRVVVNDSKLIRTSRPYYRVSVASPEVADVTPLGPDTLMVSTKTPGVTQMVLWDEEGLTQSFFVQSAADLREVQEKLDDILGDDRVEAVDLRGKIALRGVVRNAEIAATALEVAAAYAGGVENVLDFIVVPGLRQVTLEIRFAEVSRTAGKQLGVNFGYADGTSSGANTIGQINPIFPGGAESTDNGQGQINFPNDVLGATVTLFGGGEIADGAFEVFVSALRENNLMRVLAQPNLTVVSGETAEFLAGGRIPIPIPQEGGTVAIGFESYGVLLRATPIVLGDGRIRVRVTPEVSDIDRANGVSIAGTNVPAFTTRRLTTEVELGEGQTFVLAGLLNSNVQATKQAIPLLGDVPILGTLFRSTRYQKSETELVVLITPRLVAPLDADEVPPLPGENYDHPNEAELFLGGVLGGEPATPRTPRRPRLETRYTPLPPEN